jgi:hypothetical protein
MSRVELSFIAAEDTVFVLDGKEIVINPITIATLPKLVRCLEPVLTDIFALVDDPSAEAALRLIGRHGDALAEAVALCTGQPRKEIEVLRPDKFAALLMVCADVNHDFFVRAASEMKPQIAAAAPQISAKLMALNMPSSATPMPSTS